MLRDRFLLALGLSPVAAMAQANNMPPSALLNFRPTLPGVEYDTPTDPAAINACKVETVVVQNRSIGYALRDGQGKLLRRFVDNDGDNRLDQWSYYQDGFEVYREDDLDGDMRLDECRWLNAGGTRIAVITRGRSPGWKQISAEEASKVFVQGLVQARPTATSHCSRPSWRPRPRSAAAGVPKDVVERSPRRPRNAPRRSAPCRRNWSAGMPRPSGTGSTGRSRT